MKSFDFAALTLTPPGQPWMEMRCRSLTHQGLQQKRDVGGEEVTGFVECLSDQRERWLQTPSAAFYSLLRLMWDWVSLVKLWSHPAENSEAQGQHIERYALDGEEPQGSKPRLPVSVQLGSQAPR